MIKVTCNTKDSLDISELTEFQGDLKHRDENDVQKIIKSIKKHGFAFPFFVWNHDGINHVFDGHGRLLALKKLQDEGEEIPELPVVYIKAENEAEAKEMLLKLNSNYGHMTVDSVMEFLDGINIDFNDIELPDTELNFDTEEPDETEGDDECPEVSDEEPVSQLGEIYQLGDSLLMCGDSTKEEDVARLMGGIQTDLVITDPPYNVALGMGGSVDDARKRHRRTDGLVIMNDKMGENEFYEFLLKIYSNIKTFSKSGASFYIWHADNEGLNFRKALIDAGLTLRQTLIWNKNTITLGRQDYQRKHEPCLYGWIDGASHSWFSDRKQSTVIDCKRPTKSELHPTMKPVELFEYQISNSSKSGDIVLDLFGGSGTTLIACEKLNRKARLMELDPHYCDVIRKRYTQWAKENNRPITSGCLE